MPRLVVLNQVEGFRVFDLEKDTVVIGRGDDADLVLPNISISRHHAQIVCDGDSVTLTDLQSSNGTIVNGEPIQTTLLKSGDEILLGKFNLVFMGDGPEDRFYKGRYLEYMVKYDARLKTSDDSTFAMSPAQLRQMQEDAHKMRNGRMVLLTNSNRFWHPEDQTLTFGDGGMVSVDGMFTGGVIAEVAWDGKHHVVRKQARLLKLMVNDEPVSERKLTHGDRVRIANSSFRYDVAKG